MIDLATLSGLGPALAATEATFAPRLARSAATTLRRLERAGLARTSTPPTLTLPRTFSATLAAAIALDPDSPLSWHYLDTMPALHVEQLCTRAEPTATLLHTVLDWARLPRLSGAITRLTALLASAGVDATTAFGSAELRAATLADLYPRTYYGGFMPLLYGYPADMAAMARALAAGDDVHTVIDTWLAAPLTHELSHLGAARTGIFPGYLDECIAGWLSVRALPAFAYPDAGASNAIFAAPWFLQIGQALARAATPEASDPRPRRGHLVARRPGPAGRRRGAPGLGRVPGPARSALPVVQLHARALAQAVRARRHRPSARRAHPGHPGRAALGRHPHRRADARGHRRAGRRPARHVHAQLPRPGRLPRDPPRAAAHQHRSRQRHHVRPAG